MLPETQQLVTPFASNGDGVSVSHALPSLENGWPFRPFQIVSLLQMLQNYADGFFQVGEILGRINALANIAYGNQDVKLDALIQESVQEQLKLARGWCESVRLAISLKTFDWALEKLSTPAKISDLKEIFGELRRTVEREIDGVQLLHVQKEKLAYYSDARTLFGEPVIDAFPNVSSDCEDAGKCLALGLNTACVLHLMLVLQLGLNSLARELGVSFERANWDRVINDIEKQVQSIELGGTRQGPDWEADKTFFSEAALQFRHFKDAWRNHAAHGRLHYDHPDKAEKVYVHVREFMQHLATKLKE